MSTCNCDGEEGYRNICFMSGMCVSDVEIACFFYYCPGLNIEIVMTQKGVSIEAGA